MSTKHWDKVLSCGQDFVYSAPVPYKRHISSACLAAGVPGRLTRGEQSGRGGGGAPPRRPAPPSSPGTGGARTCKQCKNFGHFLKN